MEIQSVLSKRNLAISTAVMALVLHNSIGHGIDYIMGDTGYPQPSKVVNEQALAQYNSEFRLASPAGKFELQYLRTVNFKNEDKLIGARGFEGFYLGHTYSQKVDVNNACLSGTAYDIAGGTVQTNANANGLFSSASSSASANTPTVAANAEINPNNSDELIVHSGHINSKDLVFSGLMTGNSLEPVDENTKNILVTYGCKLGVISTSFVRDSGLYGQS